MFSTARSNSIQVDLTSTDLVEVLYQDQAWNQQSLTRVEQEA